MSKYKILLTGAYETAINDFFTQMGDVFECATTSQRPGDLAAHLKFFGPDLVLYCMMDESEESIKNVGAFAATLKKSNVPIGVYGAEFEISSLKSHLGGSVDLEFVRPKPMPQIKDEIVNFLDDRKLSGLSDRDMASISSGAHASQPSAAPAGAPAGGGDNRKHILVIDDDPMMLKLIREYLKADYQVATAINGRTAHKFLETRTTDLILLDYEMPGDNGPVVLKQLRENPATANIPVIFLTGITERDKIQEALAQKPQGYMLKPIDHDKLMVAVKKFL